MFLSGLAEKKCDSASENSLPNRNNNSTNSINGSSYKFPVGIQTVDDSQNVRIQLALQKYNNTSGASSSNRRIFISPLRHHFFKNPFRTRSYDANIGHHQVTSKKENMYEDRYEGVGNYPTIHLKKGSVLYRPIRRLKEVKVTCPELPINRFINQSTEFNLESKNSPKSVLDVLQDMSKKKIISKSQKDYTRGLGGDLPINEETLCRPLFVQKSKTNIVSTRDNTTQTFSSHDLNATLNGFNSLNKNLDTNDPRTELRRKLAKQNNEISASLSSSLSSTYALKRKIDKIAATPKDDIGNDLPMVAKKARVHDNATYKFNGNKVEKVANCVNSSSNDTMVRIKKSGASNKITRSPNVSERGISSPSKDRLTNIYLDMERNVSPKAQIFQNSVGTNKVCENNSSFELKNQLSSSEDNMISLTSLSKTNSLHFEAKNNEKVGTTNSTFAVSNNSITSNTTSVVSTSGVKELDLNNSNNVTFDLNASKNQTSNFFNKVESSSANPSSTLTVDPKITVDFNKVLSENSNTSDNKQLGSVLSPIVSTSGSDTSIQTLNKPSLNNIKKVGNSSVTSAFTMPGNITFQFSNNNNNDNDNDGGNNNKNKNNNTNSAIFKPSMTFSVTCDSSTLVTNSVSCAKTNLSLEQTSPKIFTSEFKSPENIANQQNFLPCSSNEEKTEKNEFSWKKSAPISSCATITTTTNTTTSTISSLSSQNLQVTNEQKTTDSATFEEEKKSIDDANKFKTSCFSFQSDKNESTQILKGFTSTLETNSTVSQPNQTSNLKTGPDKNQLFVADFLVNQKCLSTSSDVNVNTDKITPKTSGLTFNFGQKSVPENNNNNNNNTVLNSSADNSSGQNGQVFTFKQKTNLQFPFSNSNAQTSGANSQVSFSKNEFNIGANTTQTVSLLNQNKEDKSEGLEKPLFGPSTTRPPTSSQIGQAPTFGINSSLSTTKVPNALNGKSNSGIFVTQSSSIFSQSSPAIFGQGPASAPFSSTAQSTTPFVGSNFQTTAGFGMSTTAQSTISFGVPNSTQATISFGNSSKSFPTVTTTSALGSSTAFGSTDVGQSGFTLNSTSPQIAFGQSFNQNKSTVSTSGIGTTTTSIFNQSGNIAQSTQNAGFTAPTTFSSSNGSNVFGTKTVTGQSSIFGQDSKIQIPSLMGTSTSSGFGIQNKFTFNSAGNVNSFQAPQSKTSESGVFTFGANSSTGSGSTFNFGSSGSTAGSCNSAPFSFNNQNTAFKFNSSTLKETSAFNSAAPSSTFTFSAQTTNTPTTNVNNNTLEIKTPSSGVFSFGNNQMQSTGTPFNFGSTPSPSVFSFGSSSSASSGSTFNFGSPQSGSPFNSAISSSGFSAPGTFSIGSGSSSSQSRPRASARLRRRP